MWAVHLLFHPDMGEVAFLDYYGSEMLLNTCAQLLQVCYFAILAQGMRGHPRGRALSRTTDGFA